MKLLTLAAACAAVSTLAFAPAALAADAVVAKLAAPVAQKTKFIAGGALFTCEADTCVANLPTNQTVSSASCRAIVEKVGQVTALGGTKALAADKIAACNEKAMAKRSGATQLAKQ